MRLIFGTALCVLAVIGSSTMCAGQEYALTATCSILSNEPSAVYHTGGGSGGADVQIGSTNSFSCVNQSGRTLSPYLTWDAGISIHPDPINGNNGFSAPDVRGNKQVTLNSNEGWSLSNVLAGTTGPLYIGTYDCNASASLDEQKTGESVLTPEIITGIIVEV